MKKPMKAAKLSTFTRQVLAHQDRILSGYVLAVDPSSGGKSMPGYAIYRAGKLEDSGIVEVEPGMPRDRLYEINRSFREDFPEPDVLVIENVQFMPSGTGSAAFGFTKALVSLQRGIGAILSAYPNPKLVEIAPVTWRRFLPTGYQKSDENDAIMMGYVTVMEAARLAGKEPPVLPTFPDERELLKASVNPE